MMAIESAFDTAMKILRVYLKFIIPKILAHGISTSNFPGGIKR